MEVDGLALSTGPLLYLGTGRSDLALRTDQGGRVLLIGGEPFEEHIVMWWNFIGRDHDEIVAAREEWMHGDSFGWFMATPANRCLHHACPARGSGPVAEFGRYPDGLAGTRRFVEANDDADGLAILGQDHSDLFGSPQRC